MFQCVPSAQSRCCPIADVHDMSLTTIFYGQERGPEPTAYAVAFARNSSFVQNKDAQKIEVLNASPDCNVLYDLHQLRDDFIGTDDLDEVASIQRIPSFERSRDSSVDARNSPLHKVSMRETRLQRNWVEPEKKLNSVAIRNILPMNDGECTLTQ